MPVQLPPGLIFVVAKNTHGQYAPKLSSLNVEAISTATATAKMNVSFSVENAEILPNGRTYSDADWAALKDRVCFMAFETGSLSKIASETNLTMQISDINPLDSILEIYANYAITGGKIGGAG